MGVKPGWEISFGETGSRNKFLSEIIKGSPNDSIFEIEVFDSEIPPSLELFTLKNVRSKDMTAIKINVESLKVLNEFIMSMDLQKECWSIKIYKGDKVYFESYDFMYESGPFVCGNSFDEILKDLEQKGIISEHDWFEPDK